MKTSKIHVTTLIIHEGLRVEMYGDIERHDEWKEREKI